MNIGPIETKMQRNPQSSGAAPVRMTPQNVTEAVSNPTFYQNRPQFWNMLNFLFSGYQGQKVWRYLSADTFRSIVEQTHVVMEAEDEYNHISDKRQLLYHVYFVGLVSIKAKRSVAEFQAYEKPSVLLAIHYLYKQLRSMKLKMPLFCHIPNDLKI